MNVAFLASELFSRQNLQLRKQEAFAVSISGTTESAEPAKPSKPAAEPQPTSAAAAVATGVRNLGDSEPTEPMHAWSQCAVASKSTGAVYVPVTNLGVPCRLDRKVTKALNGFMTPAGPGKPFYTGGKGILVRNVLDGLVKTDHAVVPASMLVNDMIMPSTVYPSGNPQVDSEPSENGVSPEKTQRDADLHCCGHDFVRAVPEQRLIGIQQS